MFSISSGKLASNNIFCLDENVREKMVKDEQQKNKKAGELQQRKDIQQAKQRTTFRQAAKKHFNKHTLNATEIKSLLKHIHVKTDSPNGKKISDLRKQLHNRQQRLEMYNFNSDDDMVTRTLFVDNKQHGENAEANNNDGTDAITYASINNACIIDNNDDMLSIDNNDNIINMDIVDGCDGYAMVLNNDKTDDMTSKLVKDICIIDEHDDMLSIENNNGMLSIGTSNNNNNNYAL
jgi:hypothetical protein